MTVPRPDVPVPLSDNAVGSRSDFRAPPVFANLTRLAIAAGGGWLALRWSDDLSHVFLALSAALAAFGLINAAAVASGAWFGRVGRPRRRTARLHRSE